MGQTNIKLFIIHNKKDNIKDDQAVICHMCNILTQMQMFFMPMSITYEWLYRKYTNTITYRSIKK